MSPVDFIIIAAMDEEVAPFLARATSHGETVQVGNAIHHRVTLAGRDALVVRGGVGLVNAACAATSALLLAHKNTAGAPAPLLISAGTAGGLGEYVRVGDVVIATDTINADADARAFGYLLGQVPGMPVSYPVPGALRQLSAVQPSQGGLVQSIHQGLMVSSYTFVGHERSVIIKETFDGVLATDMESSAIAQTAYSFNAPFLAVRGVSDLCGPASDADFLVHVDDAAERSAEVVMAVVQSWLGAGSPRPEAAPTT
ncbi:MULTISPECIES: 5'-methylthioadenosine/S-adenosylhomocysteine nucleosidase [Arthrobacter]|uniref:adenosylhomocysteine nucleosidase n=1 Tax=Arthrobacter psychrochitiniphilus TaxID=291045 RepID=A0A2V3DPT9_9MICC|nr:MULTISPECIES: 5'-methylthioadenosine/S-adenosylhomocysteine nucleosidase [Arthrobacter]NYG17513.1 adenosylhomocysteine nucleosidase [Arthrobacter psychrochitiniphilus]PXA64701.1 5'-methylthioadenosine/S-adenosylhomocysteine nucleosidase [Arthrobacter psychrochitiniphilus]